MNIYDVLLTSYLMNDISHVIYYMTHNRTSFWSPVGSGRELRPKCDQFPKRCSVPRLFGCFERTHTPQVSEHMHVIESNGLLRTCLEKGTSVYGKPVQP